MSCARPWCALALLTLCAPTFAQERVKLEWKVTPEQPVAFELVMSPYQGTQPLAPILKPGLLEALARRRAAGQGDGELSPALREVFAPPARRSDPGQSTKVLLTHWTPDRFRGTLTSPGPGGKEYVLGRLVVNPQGQSESFWVPFQVRSMFVPLLELAPRAVQVGERWPIHVHLLQQRLPLKVKSSHQANQVTLAAFDPKTGEATLDYLISEEVVGAKAYPEDEPFDLAMHVLGRGVFSTRRGCWSWLELRLVLCQGGSTQEVVLRATPLKD